MKSFMIDPSYSTLLYAYSNQVTLQSCKLCETMKQSYFIVLGHQETLLSVSINLDEVLICIVLIFLKN